MISLGKLTNPMTGKAEKNLPAARLFIDTLEMLERKTQNNLTADETKVLHATLTDLRLMFVEESKSPPAAEPTKQPETKPEAPKAETPNPDESNTKFHKSYE